METAPFVEWLVLQRHLQVEAFNRDPALLDGDDRADFMLWNAWAAEDELHEAFQEVIWKPWVHARRGDFIDREAFIAEIVDVLHFVGNLLLCASQVHYGEFTQRDGEFGNQYVDVGGLADEVWAAYQSKIAKNIARQRDKYTGLDKCKQCGRDLPCEVHT